MRPSEICPHQSLRQKRGICTLLLTLLLVGCNTGNNLPPVDRDLAETIKASSQLADAEAVLGQPHAPSNAQKKQMAGVISRMREETRKNAERDG